MVRLLATLTLVNALLVAIAWLRGDATTMTWLALEAPVVAGLLALLPRRRWAGAVGVAAGLGLAFLLLLALGDRLVRFSLGRAFDPYVDWRLLRPLFDLATGQGGAAFGAVAALVVMLAAIAAALALARVLARQAGHAPAGHVPLAAALLLAGGCALAAVSPRLPGVAAPGWRLAAEQAGRTLATRADARAFARELAAAPRGAAARPLRGLADRDVVVGFIESYGVSALRDPVTRGPVARALDGAGAAIDAAGLHVATGRVRAPTTGGQSWLAHATFLSGRRLDNDARHDRLLASGQATLVDDLEATGQASVAVMPAITRDWAAGRALGYDRVLDARRMGYAGPAFDWVTMPDQYTWRVVERARAAADGPLFVQTALISSHAPWDPVLPVLAWERIGDGRVFRRWADAGEGGLAVARDPARLRARCGRALAYALRVAGEYAARDVDADTLLLLLGDHPPPPAVVADRAAAATVPVHAISGDPRLLRAFRERGFVPGMRPPTDGPVPSMADLRGWLHEAFAGPPRYRHRGARAASSTRLD